MEIRKRNPLISAFLSFISPGLGQIYNGQLRKGITYFIISLLIFFIYSIAKLYFFSFIIFLFILICWSIFVVIDSIIISARIKYIKLNNYNKWYIYLFIILLTNISVYTTEKYLITTNTYYMTAGSMQQTFLKGDYLISNNSAYGWRNPFSNKGWFSINKPNRGDVVTFIYPQDQSKEYIKRIIGLPGDRVQIIDKKVYINGELYQTPQARFADNKVIPPAQSTRDNYGPVVVPKDSYFVLGDNRDQSYDSRFWGFVPSDLIQGKVLYVYFSWDKENSRIRWDRIGLSVN